MTKSKLRSPSALRGPEWIPGFYPWRPIATYPKGKRVILWCGSDQLTFVGNRSRSRWIGCRFHTPTAWMTIPGGPLYSGRLFTGGLVCFLAGCITVTVVVDLIEEK